MFRLKRLLVLLLLAHCLPDYFLLFGEAEYNQPKNLLNG